MTEPAATATLLAAIGILLALAGLASPLSGRFGVPALVIFLALGIAAGSEGIGGIPFDDHRVAFRLGSVALVLILFDGSTQLVPGDEVCVFAMPSSRALLDLLFGGALDA